MSDNPEYKTTTSGLPKIYVSETVEPETLSPDNSATEVPLDESTVSYNFSIIQSSIEVGQTCCHFQLYKRKIDR